MCLLLVYALHQKHMKQFSINSLSNCKMIKPQPLISNFLNSSLDFGCSSLSSTVLGLFIFTFLGTKKCTLPLELDIVILVKSNRLRPPWCPTSVSRMLCQLNLWGKIHTYIYIYMVESVSKAKNRIDVHMEATGALNKTDCRSMQTANS